MRVQFYDRDVTSGRALLSDSNVLNIPDANIRPGDLVRVKLPDGDQLRVFKVLDGPRMVDQAPVGTIDSWRVRIPVEEVEVPKEDKAKGAKK